MKAARDLQIVASQEVGSVVRWCSFPNCISLPKALGAGIYTQIRVSYTRVSRSYAQDQADVSIAPFIASTLLKNACVGSKMTELREHTVRVPVRWPQQ